MAGGQQWLDLPGVPESELFGASQTSGGPILSLSLPLRPISEHDYEY